METIVLVLIMAGTLAFGYFLIDRTGRFLEDQRKQSARRELSAREYGKTVFGQKHGKLRRKDRHVPDGLRWIRGARSSGRGNGNRSGQ